MKLLAMTALIALALPHSAALAQNQMQDTQKLQEDMLIQQIQQNSERAMSEGLGAPAQLPAQNAPIAEQQAPAPTTETQAITQAIPPKDLPSRYAPDHCEFEAAFPEDPYVQNKCDGGESGTECYDLVSYTQTFALDATVTMRVVCNKIGQDIKDKYDEAVMIKTLEAMTKQNVVQQFSTSYMEEENGNYRLAGLVGEGKVGMIPSIFIAQMWLGKSSAMTIEAELVGEQFNESDALFRDLLRGIRFKGTTAPSEKVKAEDTTQGESTSSPADE